MQLPSTLHTLPSKVAAAILVAASVGGCEPRVERHEGSEPGDCADGADNDRDGLFDCADSGCGGAPSCEGVSSTSPPGADGGPSLSCIPAPPAPPPCTRAARSCIEAASQPSEVEACLATEPHPDACMRCIANEHLACGRDNGCGALAETFACCVEAECGDLSAASGECRGEAVNVACTGVAQPFWRCFDENVWPRGLCPKVSLACVQ